MGRIPAGRWCHPGPAYLTVALAGLLQDAQRVVGPLPFAVELHPPGQPVILYLAGREAGQRDGRQGPETGGKARQGRDDTIEKGAETGEGNRGGRIKDSTAHRQENERKGTRPQKGHNPNRESGMDRQDTGMRRRPGEWRVRIGRRQRVGRVDTVIAPA